MLGLLVIIGLVKVSAEAGCFWLEVASMCGGGVFIHATERGIEGELGGILYSSF